jgi:hypothetical protein
LVNVIEVGVPRIGVTRVGLVERTFAPEPVVDVTPVPPFATGSVPETPVVNERPVALVRLTDVGVPRIGVTRVGLVERTFAPEPVLVVTPVPPFKTGSVPVTPLVNERPVALVKVIDVGIPRIGVTRVGLVERTFAPEPVLVVTPVPPLVTGSVPVTPVASGRPIALVNVAETGVPKSGATRGYVPLLMPFNAVTIGVKLLSK